MKEIFNIEPIKQKYPYASGIILTGSQINRSSLDSDTDVDLIVVDAQFSVVTSLIISIEGQNYDITQVPLNNIINVLFNELHDTRGGLLSMIVKGKILSDDNKALMLGIKEIAERYYNKGNFSVNNVYNLTVDNLSKLRAQCEKSLDRHQRFLLLNEIIRLITQAELIRQSKWLPNGKQKPRFLSKSNPGLLDELILFTLESCSTNDVCKLSNLGNYIDFYLQQLVHLNAPLPDERYILDISYENCSVEDFVINVLPLIKSEPNIGGQFLLYFATPALLHRVYKNKICIVFDLTPQVKPKDVYLAIKNLFIEKLRKSLKISTTATEIYSDVSPNRLSLLDFENVSKQLNFFTEYHLKENAGYDHERFFYTGLILTGFIVQNLNLEVDDVLKVNRYLHQRWLFSPAEQYNIKSPEDLQVLRQKKYDMFNVYYLQNQELIIKMIKKGLVYTKMVDESSSQSYHQVIISIERVLQKNVDETEEILSANRLTKEILQADFEVVDSKKGLLYLLTIENVLRMLNLTPPHICLLLFSTSKTLEKILKQSNLQ